MSVSLQRILGSVPDSPTSREYRELARSLLPFADQQRRFSPNESDLSRLRFLYDIARVDLGLARLAEGHLDAVQIMAEAGEPTRENALYGIWASGGPADTTTIEAADEPNRFSLEGQKPFCSGADLVDFCLLHVSSRELLVHIDMQAAARNEKVAFIHDQWKTDAFACVDTWSVSFNALSIDSSSLIGRPQWYFSRPGFSRTALCPAACWVGGARRLVEEARHKAGKTVHGKAHYGAMMATLLQMEAMLRWGAEQGQLNPSNDGNTLFPVALLVRQVAERGCQEIIDRFGRLMGPRPLAFDAKLSRHVHELSLYIRQNHAEADLEEVGEFLSSVGWFPQAFGP